MMNFDLKNCLKLQNGVTDYFLDLTLSELNDQMLERSFFRIKFQTRAALPVQETLAETGNRN